MTNPILVMEGEWQCIEQEGGYVAPGCYVGESEVGVAICRALGLPEDEYYRPGKGVRLRLTVTVIRGEA